MLDAPSRRTWYRQAMPRRTKKAKARAEVEEADHVMLDHVWLAWIQLTPAERLRRSWAMRSRLRDPQAVHDAKLFPQP
jgi:hypothetical protein